MRHDKRVKEAIRKNLKELIAEENIITSDGRKLVKIPLRYLDQYRFRFGQMGNGTGQGKGNIGDVIARDEWSDQTATLRTRVLKVVLLLLPRLGRAPRLGRRWAAGGNSASGAAVAR